MKKKWMILGMVLLMMSSLMACQATPEEDVVANKGEGRLESMIQETQTMTESADGQSMNQAETVQVTDSFLSDGGDVTIQVNAAMSKDNIPMPVIYVVPRDITVDEVKHWAKVFFGTEDVYEPVDVMTKAEIEEEILWRQEKINDREGMLEEYLGNESDVDDVIDYYEGQIDNFRKAYENAPEDYERPKTDWTFRPQSYYAFMKEMDGAENITQEEIAMDATMQLRIISDIDGQEAAISASNRSESDYMLHQMCFYYLGEESVKNRQEAPSISEEEAVALADKQVEALMGEAWYLADSSSYGNVWRLYYTPVREGVPCIGEYDLALFSEDAYAANLDYEYLCIEIVDDRIISVEWQSPMEVVSVENSNVALKSFDDIYESFKTYMKMSSSKSEFYCARDEWLDEEMLKYVDEKNAEIDAMDMRIDITSIKEGLFRIKVKDSNEFRYVPAYAFYGISWLGDSPDYEKNYCIINAVDGSIINTWLGY